MLTSVLAAVSLVSLGTVGPAIASSRHVQAGGPLYARFSTSNNVFEIVNGSGYCLDANDTGSTAGTNGDKVQLWTCNHTDNQFWYLGSETPDGAYPLVNDEYPSKCLNTDDTGGVADGSHVQLWNCSVDTFNEYWDLASWEKCSGYPGTEPCPIFLDVNNYEFMLDATSQDIGNGDQIQVWTSEGGNNQLWTPYPS